MGRLLLLSVATLGTLFSVIATPASASTASIQCVQQYEVPQIRYPPAVVLESTPPSSPQPSTSAPPPQSSDSSRTRLARTTTPSTLPSTQPTWQPPSANILWSPWHMTHSTRPSYLTLTNMQATHYPLFPSTPHFPCGSQIDVVSWSTSANATDLRITTVFGYFTPVAPAPATDAVWRYSSTGVLANVTNLWAVLGSGVDSDGVEYRVDYETGYYVEGTDAGATSEPCINIASRRQGGPSNLTYAEVVQGLKAVGYRNGDDGFVELVAGLRAMRFDARREEAVEVDCDQACMNNTGLGLGHG